MIMQNHAESWGFWKYVGASLFAHESSHLQGATCLPAATCPFACQFAQLGFRQSELVFGTLQSCIARGQSRGSSSRDPLFGIVCGGCMWVAAGSAV